MDTLAARFREKFLECCSQVKDQVSLAYTLADTFGCISKYNIDGESEHFSNIRWETDVATGDAWVLEFTDGSKVYGETDVHSENLAVFLHMVDE